MKRIASVGLVLLLVGCGDSRAASRETPHAARVSSTIDRPARDSASEVTTFARDFYAWYGAHVQDLRTDGVDLVLRDRPAALTPQLREALAADRARQDSAKGELVGLDFDPFLASQDPCPHYEVGSATHTAKGFEIPIRGTCGSSRTVPDAIVHVMNAPTGWAIADVSYPKTPQDGGLLATLRALAREDTK